MAQEDKPDVMDEEAVNPKFAMFKEPIVGTEVVAYEDGRGAGAISPRPLPSPKEMTEARRKVHEIAHLPYDPSCAICVSRRRPNDHHRATQDLARMIPLLFGDYAFSEQYGRRGFHHSTCHAPLPL